MWVWACGQQMTHELRGPTTTPSFVATPSLNQSWRVQSRSFRLPAPRRLLSIIDHRSSMLGVSKEQSGSWQLSAQAAGNIGESGTQYYISEYCMYYQQHLIHAGRRTKSVTIHLHRHGRRRAPVRCRHSTAARKPPCPPFAFASTHPLPKLSRRAICHEPPPPPSRRLAATRPFSRAAAPPPVPAQAGKPYPARPRTRLRAARQQPH